MLSVSAFDYDGDEFPFTDTAGDDLFTGSPVNYQCQACDGTQLSQSSSTRASNSTAAVSPSGIMYGGGDAQFKVASMNGPTPSDLGTIFGQTLLVNDNQFAQSGVGKGLYISNYFGQDESLVSPGTAMFGPELSVAQMPQLLCYVGNWDLTKDGGGNWTATAGTDLGGSTIIAIDGSVTDTFDLNMTTETYEARYGVHASLTHDSSSHQYVLVDEAGDMMTFRDFSFNPNEYSAFNTSTPPMPADQGEFGQLTSITDAGGNRATFHYDDAASYATPQVNGSTYTYQLVSVTLTSAGSTAVADEYDYSYTSPVSQTLCSNVALYRLNGGAKPSLPIQQVQYAYYGGTSDPSDAFGDAGEMKLATIEGPTGQVIDNTYFRWYTATSSFTGAYDGKLQSMLSNASFNRLAAFANPLTTADVSAYADVTLGYVVGGAFDGQVATLKLQGAGCSVCNAGLGTYTYSYQSIADSINNIQLSTYSLNAWATITTEGLPDGSTNVVFSNDIGETLLSDHYVTLSGPHWLNYYHYDCLGRVDEMAGPSAVSLQTGATQDFNYDGSFNIQLNPTSGPIEHIDYDGDTTSNTVISGGQVSPQGTGGDASGYVADHWVEQGSQGKSGNGNWTYLDSETYFDVTANYPVFGSTARINVTIDLPASTTLFSQPLTQSLSTTSGADTTTYAYTFQQNQVWVQQETDYLPKVDGTGDEGTGNGGNDSTSVFMDAHGRPIFTQEANGAIDYTQYDSTTGALLEEIQDIKSTQLGVNGVPNLPTGWSLFGTSHQGLVTRWVTDQLGRSVIQIDPLNHVAFTVYSNPTLAFTYDPTTGLRSTSGTVGPSLAFSEVRSYSGWDYNGTGSLTAASSYARDANTTPPPIDVMIQDIPVLAQTPDIDNDPVTVGESYSEEFTMAAGTPVQSTQDGLTLPVGGEPIANLQTLSVAISNTAGQVVLSDDYYNLTGLDLNSADQNALINGIGQFVLPQYQVVPGTQWIQGATPSSANYYSTSMAYDDLGLLARVVNANGTIYRYVHDSLGRTTSTWFGTHGWNAFSSANPPDDGNTWSAIDEWVPANPGGMVELSANVYDAGGVGDSNLTETVEFPNGNGVVNGVPTASAATGTGGFRVTENAYNWQDQLISSKSGVAVTEVAVSPATAGSVPIDGLSDLSSGAVALLDAPQNEGTNGDTTKRPITFDVLDNLGEVTYEYTFDGTGIALGAVVSYFAGNPSTPNYGSLLRSYVANSFDARGREYQTTQYSVSQSDGTIGTSGYDAPETTLTQFDANDNVTLVTDPMLNKTTYSYDLANRLTSRRDPNPTNGGTSGGPFTQYGYDAASNLITETDPLNHVTSYQYDAANREVKFILPQPVGGAAGGPTTVYAYDPNNGWLKSITDPFGNVTQKTYDALGRGVTLQLPPITVNNATTYPTVAWTYDGDSNVLTETDPDNNTTTYSYDPLDQLSSKSENVAKSYYLDAQQHVQFNTATNLTQYTHNNLGDLTQTIDGDGKTVNYSVNTLGQQIGEQWAAGLSNSITSAFTALGDLSATADAFSNYSMAFDGFDRLHSVDNHGGSVQQVPDVVLTSGYDADGNRLSLAANVNATADFQNNYTYDRLNRETQVVQQGNGGWAVAYKKATFGYDAASRLTTLAHYNSSTNQVAFGNYGYDAVNRITSLSWMGPNGPFNSTGQNTGYGGYYEQMSWSYDSDSRVASFSSTDYAAENLTYTYDHDSQLTGAAAPYGGGYGGGYGGLGGGTWTWDGNGDSTLAGHITGPGNRLLSDGTYNYTFDVSGHVLTRVNKTTGAETDYGWDNRSRLISVKDFASSGGAQTQEVDYTYDVFNRLITRVLKSNYSGGIPQTVTTGQFVYDGNNIVLVFNGNQALTDRYLWGPAVDQILDDEQFSANATQMPTSAGTLFEVLGDNEWNVRDLVSGSGLVAHFAYDAFGKLVSSSGSASIRFMHNGTFYDSATGLEYHSADGTGRWYNAADQRWMSEDPMGLTPDANPYRYCGNSPTNWVDPSGLFPPAPQGGRGRPWRPPARPAGGPSGVGHQGPVDAFFSGLCVEFLTIGSYGWHTATDWTGVDLWRSRDERLDRWKRELGIGRGTVTYRIGNDAAAGFVFATLYVCSGPSQSESTPPPVEEPIPPPGPSAGDYPLGGGTTSGTTGGSGGWTRWGPGRGPGGNPISGDVPPTPWYPPPLVKPPMRHYPWGPPLIPN